MGCRAVLTWPLEGSSETLKIVSIAAATGEALHILSHLTPPSSAQKVLSYFYK